MRLSVGDGDSLQLVSLLEGVRVGRLLGGVDELVGQALGDRLDVTERSFTSTCAQEPDGLVDTSERRNVDGLTSHSTGATDSRRIFSWAAVLDRVDQDFQRILSSKQMNNFESVFNNTNSHELLAVVSTVHHERAGQTLDNGAESLVKSFDLITASCVR